MSQPKLAAPCASRISSLHKYELAKNRISASRLYELSKVLGVPVTFFLKGIAEIEAAAQTPKAGEEG